MHNCSPVDGFSLVNQGR